MEPAWTSAGFHDPLKMVRDKIRVKRSAIGLCADVTGINLLIPPKPLVFGLLLLYLQKIGPHCSCKRKMATAGGRLGIVQKDDLSLILHCSVANIEGPGIKIYRLGDFEELKNTLTNGDGKPYPSGRDFAEDSVRLLESAACCGRWLAFMPFSVLDGFAALETKAKQLQELGRYGFYGSDCLAGRGSLSREDLNGALERLPQYAQRQGLPIDGILFTYNDMAVSHTQKPG